MRAVFFYPLSLTPPPCRWRALDPPPCRWHHFRHTLRFCIKNAELVVYSPPPCQWRISAIFWNTSCWWRVCPVNDKGGGTSSLLLTFPCHCHFLLFTWHPISLPMTSFSPHTQVLHNLVKCHAAFRRFFEAHQLCVFWVKYLKLISCCIFSLFCVTDSWFDGYFNVLLKTKKLGQLFHQSNPTCLICSQEKKQFVKGR